MPIMSWDSGVPALSVEDSNQLAAIGGGVVLLVRLWRCSSHSLWLTLSHLQCRPGTETPYGVGKTALKTYIPLTP